MESIGNASSMLEFAIEGLKPTHGHQGVVLGGRDIQDRRLFSLIHTIDPWEETPFHATTYTLMGEAHKEAGGGVAGEEAAQEVLGKRIQGWERLQALG